MKNFGGNIAAVVVHFGSPAETIGAVASLLNSSQPVSVVVVNNGSASQATEIHRAVDENGWTDQVTVVGAGQNRGFAGGVNEGVRHALAGSPQYVFLLNNDARVAPDTLDRLVQASRADPAFGVLSALVRYADWPDLVWSAGGRWSRWLGSLREVRLTTSEHLQTVVDVDVVAGCAMLIPRSTIDRIGLLDERYFMYYEDSDYCLRARAAGLKVGVVPSANCYHRVGLQARVMAPDRVGHWAQSKAYFYVRWAGRKHVARAFVTIGLGAVSYCISRLLSLHPRPCVTYLSASVAGWQAAVNEQPWRA
jgi:GT2 family glycosyltransferase